MTACGHFSKIQERLNTYFLLPQASGHALNFPWGTPVSPGLASCVPWFTSCDPWFIFLCTLILMIFHASAILTKQTWLLQALLVICNWLLFLAKVSLLLLDRHASPWEDSILALSLFMRILPFLILEVFSKSTWDHNACLNLSISQDHSFVRYMQCLLPFLWSITRENSVSWLFKNALIFFIVLCFLL